MAWRFLIVSGAVLLAGFALLSQLEAKRRSKVKPLPVLKEVGAFSLTNQWGASVGGPDLMGRPWAVNLIFTRCPGPCLQLSGTMKRVQALLPADSRAGLISVSSDPGFDIPRVLTIYAGKVGADTNRWQFLTGSTQEIRRLVTEKLLLVLVDKPEEQRTVPEDLFLHSTLIVLLDRQGRLRGAVEGLEAGAAEKVVEMLGGLEKE